MGCLKSLLHVGCGGDTAPEWAKSYREVRLDIDEKYSPDIVASMVDMGDIGQFDALYCSHALEHLHYSDVGKALSEFYRVLVPGGVALVFVPNIEWVRPTDDVLYVSPGGPVSGLDLIYGMRSLSKENPYMMHKTGFVPESFESMLKTAGFSQVTIHQLYPYNLMGVAVK